MTKDTLTVVSTIVSLVGIGASVLSTWLGNKQLDVKIEEKVKQMIDK